MFTKFFKQLLKNDISVAGGKGASLGEMTNARIPVPPGFVVLATVFDRFLEETDLGVEIEAKMTRVDHKDINSVDKASNEIRDLIGDVEFPKDIGKEIIKEFTKLKTKYVAVRSSATAEDSSVASWAGELETYLNVTQKNLLDSVKKCWSSLFTPRAIFYRFEKDLHKQKVSVAVIIQKMIQSEISGVCFTVHPVTKDKNQIVIEAVWGLGESLVQGKVTPDTYIIEKSKIILRQAQDDTERSRSVKKPALSSSKGQKSKFILDKNINLQEKMIVRSKLGTKIITVPKSKRNKQKISEKQTKELAKLCIRIERHYKVPQDIEWVLAKNKFYITQSRPITTL